MRKRAAAVALALVGLFIVAQPVRADDYPSRPITIVVPYPAGGPTDQTGRLLAQSLSKQLKQSVIIENVSGGGTIIGTNKVVKAAPDGYTLLLHNLQISANVTLYKNLPFNTEKDLTPIIFVNRNPLVLVGRRSLAANDLTQLVALMKKSTMKAAIPGYGATGHLATALLAQEAGAKIDMIPYRGAAPAINDLLGEHVDLFFATPQSIVQQVAVGHMKAYGITSKDKVPELPNVQSFVAVFGPKLEIEFWQALFAPAGTPDTVIKKLNEAVRIAVSDPTVAKIWKKEGVSAYPKDEQTTTAARTMLHSEIERWGQVVKNNNIHIDQ
jgi:tripartite-type tricarboxylate transporter receptor subunit TctC